MSRLLNITSAFPSYYFLYTLGITFCSIVNRRFPSYLSSVIYKLRSGFQSVEEKVRFSQKNEKVQVRVTENGSVHGSGVRFALEMSLNFQKY